MKEIKNNLKNCAKQVKSKLGYIHSLQFTFTSQITFVIIVLFSIGNVIIFRSISEQLIRNTHLRNREQVQDLVNSVDQWKQSTGLLMSSLSRQPSLINLNEKGIEESLKEIVSLTPDRVWRVFDTKGILKYTSIESERNTHQRNLLQLRQKDYEGYKKAQKGQFNWSIAFLQAGFKTKGCLSAQQPIINATDKGTSEVVGSLSFCLPLEKLGKAIGIAGTDRFSIDQDESSITTEVNSKQSPDYLEFHRGDYKGRVTYMIFESGNIVFPTATDSRFVQISIQSPRRLSTTAWGRLNQMVTRRGNFNTFQKIELDGRPLLTFSMNSTGWNSNWIAVNAIDEETVFEPLNKALLSLMILQISTLIITSIAIYFVCRQLTKPLNLIIARIQTLSTLNLEESQDYTIKKAWIREINNVTKATNRLTRAIDSFSRYLPREVVKSLLLDDRRAVLGGSSEKIAVMFTDIDNFTSYTESVETQQLFRFLNEYFTELTKQVVTHQGTIDKYIGDSLMIMWGMPNPLENPCELACETAIAVRNASNRLRDLWTMRNEPLQFNTRIGLHYGEAIVGNVGAEQRFNYTIVGDTVNLASRLEGTNKEFKTNIIVSQSVLEKLDEENVSYKFAFRMLGEVNVKGKRISTLIYELYDHRSSLRQNQIQALDAWNRVMKIAVEQNATAALEALSQEDTTIQEDSLLIQLKHELKSG